MACVWWCDVRQSSVHNAHVVSQIILCGSSESMSVVVVVVSANGKNRKNKKPETRIILRLKCWLE